MLVKNHFEIGPQGWCSYDYHACITANAEIAILATHRLTGGPNNGPYVWVDHHRWSTDTPERPISILAFYTYRSWTDQGIIDLRNAEVSVYLRGDNLDLLGGECYFWANMGGTRWHLKGQPLHISQGEWAAEPNRIKLVNDESQWYLSWPGLPANPRPLDTMLSHTSSYGFSFVGFAREI